MQSTIFVVVEPRDQEKSRRRLGFCATKKVCATPLRRMRPAFAAPCDQTDKRVGNPSLK